MLMPRSKGCLIQDTSELPDYRQAKLIFADFETSSKSPTESSVNPWHNCYVEGSAGLAVSADDDGRVYYVPANVLNSDLGKVWLRDTFAPDKTWINHNIKYDANVLANCCGVLFKGKMICTLMAAKIVDSDRWEHSLDSLAAQWLQLRKAGDMLAPYLKQPNGNWKNKDYGSVPVDILGDYACEDVNLNRRLYHRILTMLPPESRDIYELEQTVTRALFEIERNGMRLKPRLEIEKERYRVMNELFNKIMPQLEEIVGFKFEPHVNAQCEQVLTEMFKFPILSYTDKGMASYDKHVLLQYLSMRKHTKLIELCIEWRKLWIYHNLFLKTYLDLAIDDVLHPTYNQTVRTGRMSCGQPNMQQLNKLAKALIVPREGYRFFSTDAKQIEFRLIVHYIKNPYALRAYEDDPDTDYHNWVSEMVGIPRSPAKTMNFMLGYGGGKKMTVLRLQNEVDLMESLREGCQNEAQFDVACRQKANEVYGNYHEALPELKVVSKRAELVCRQRGYVRNLYGRRRTLPSKAAYKAFNTLNQSSAADIVKESVVGVRNRLDALGARMVAVVHDEILLEVPDEVPDEKVTSTLLPILEAPSVPLRVPIRWSTSWSRGTWAECE